MGKSEVNPKINYKERDMCVNLDCCTAMDDHEINERQSKNAANINNEQCLHLGETESENQGEKSECLDFFQVSL